MWAATPPDEVTALRDMMKACAVASTYGLNADGRYHYPQAALTSDDASTPDTMPLVVLADTDTEAVSIGEIGAGSINRGTLTATIHAELEADVLEVLARTFRTQLLGQATGLANLSVRTGLATDPMPGARAGDSDGGTHANAGRRAITLTCTYGLE